MVKEMEGDIGDVLHRCEQAMKGRRLKDFFIEIDVDERGVVSAAALKDFVALVAEMKAHGVTVQKQMFYVCKRVAKRMTSPETAPAAFKAPETPSADMMRWKRSCDSW